MGIFSPLISGCVAQLGRQKSLNMGSPISGQSCLSWLLLWVGKGAALAALGPAEKRVRRVSGPRGPRKAPSDILHFQLHLSPHPSDAYSLQLPREADRVGMLMSAQLQSSATVP